ncbi:hypothetical protein I302_100015 [Kwoniella bestiolae CBS 10118]|uniref:ATP-dependent RNA helicase MRH4, mitochondrial n=1 Tax=Kwoniella bestiolae CBS 10118 TaxID=1296100 RepID=A0A1B9G3V5_9TREE|nr:hypothetical protein I302_03387 [Kwoniella bestiolae CBS 10118]OCF25714.1 hypothetical protein I302_03387 [Kwoniella bestiolae CBS 10118]
MRSFSSPSTSRIAHIALTTPPLRSILFRALHASSTANGGGPRTVQPGKPNKGSFSKHSPSRPSFGVRSSIGQKPAFGKRPSFDRSTTDRYPRSSSFTPSPKYQDKGRIQPTSSRRLASFDQPPTRYNSAKSPFKTAGEDEDVERTPSPRFPKSQPFQPPTYGSTATLSDPAAAAPQPFNSFDLAPGLLEALTSQYGEDGKTTPIQSLSYSNLLSTSISDQGGLRAILGAETGSGKTMSYLVPLFQHLKSTDPTSSESSAAEDALHPRSIILSPTHELTRQSTRFAKSLTHMTKLSVMGLSNTAAGGVGARRGTVDVLLGTVGSIRRMLGIRKDNEHDEDGQREDIGEGLWKKDEKTGLVRSDQVEWVVIDEADVLLGNDFLGETLSILSKLPSARINLILCTATLPPSLLNLLSSHPLFSSTKFKHYLSPGLHKLPSKLETRFVPPSRSGSRLADVAHEVRRVFADDAIKAKQNEDQADKKKSKIVVFCNSDKKVEQLSNTLESKGLHCLNWTSESQYRQRGRNGLLDTFLTKAVQQSPRRKFQETEQGEELILNEKAVSKEHVKPSSTPSPRILVTTSLLSRGLDFSSSVSSVFLLDPPRDVLDFVHRAGRAGRAGREGRVVVFGLGDGSGIGKSNKKGKELQVGEVLGKTQIRRQMLGGRVKRARL